MAFTIEERSLHPLTADQVVEMATLGLFDQGPRVELLHGALTRMSPHNPEHAVPIERLTLWLASAVQQQGLRLRVQLSFRVKDETSLPEPDLLVSLPEGTDHPRAAVLVIEVANSSLNLDTKVKGPLYAATGVPEYWIVDAVTRQVHVHTEPTPSDGYARTTTYGDGQEVSPRAVTAAPLDVTALFRGL